jgi:hypothetical protein
MTKAALRRQLLQLTATVSSLAALGALLDPDRVAQAMVRLATAGLALLAARQGEQPLLGDITAMFVLAQPAGRFIAAFAIGLPRGLLLIVCGLELAGGLALLALRPR